MVLRAGEEGVEPPTCGFRVRCSTIELLATKFGANAGVGMVGFEPTTTWSQTRCATKLRYIPKIFDVVGAGGRSRSCTPNRYRGLSPTRLPFRHTRVRPPGLEPRTVRLKVSCSTN